MNLGLAYSAQGEYEKAIGYYEKSLAIDREIGDRESEGGNLVSLGDAYAAVGEYEKAVPLLE